MSSQRTIRTVLRPAVLLAIVVIPSCTSMASAGGQPAPADRATVSSDADVLTRAQIDRIDASRTTELFEGRFAGVQVLTSGSTPRLVIRGYADPLIVIDDVPQADPAAVWSLLPRNIEEIRILRESGLARYGERGAHGVVVITTRER